MENKVEENNTEKIDKSLYLFDKGFNFLNKIFILHFY